jgi:Bacterial DNA-binding protein
VATIPKGVDGRMNKGGLVAEVAKRTGVSKAEVARVVDASIDVIRETVVGGERVTLADFGTFYRGPRPRPAVVHGGQGVSRPSLGRVAAA